MREKYFIMYIFSIPAESCVSSCIQRENDSCKEFSSKDQDLAKIKKGRENAEGI